MKKPRKNLSRRAAAATTLRDLLEFLPISHAKAFEIAQVHRTTWKRWLNGQGRPPAATVDLIKIRAYGELPDQAFSGFRVTNGVMVDDFGQEHSPEDIRGLTHYKQKCFEYFSVMEMCDFVPKAEKKPDQAAGRKLRLVR